MADFARAQLLKYGWTEGRGLGKEENGIVAPLRPNLKFDKIGLGCKDKSDDKWWERAYEEASSGVTIRSSKDGGCEISAVESFNSAVKKIAKPLGGMGHDYSSYVNNFRKTCTLQGGETIFEEKEKCDEKVAPRLIVDLTDEELLRACGGRTAHKGARHGLRLSGKLARIAEQEAKLLRSSTENFFGIESSNNIKSEPEIFESLPLSEFCTKKKKKMKRKRCDSATANAATMAKEKTMECGENAENDRIAGILENDDEPSSIPKKSKKARRKEKRSFQELADRLDAFTLIDNDDDDKSRRKNEANKLNDEDNEEPTNKETRRERKSKKKLKETTETEKLNRRIGKKKKAKTTKHLKRLVDCLESVDLCDNVEEKLRTEESASKFSQKLTKRMRKKEIGKLKKKKKKVSN